MSREGVEQSIRKVFPLKSKDSVKALMDIMARAASLKDPGMIKYPNLLPQVSPRS